MTVAARGLVGGGGSITGGLREVCTVAVGMTVGGGGAMGDWRAGPEGAELRAVNKGRRSTRVIAGACGGGRSRRRWQWQL
jgi:hypothetical protein